MNRNSIPDQTSLTTKTLRGAGWLASSNIFLSIARLAAMAVMARLLSPVEFGIMAAAGIFIEFARLLTESGIIQTLIQRQSLSERHIQTAFTANILSAILATALMCLSAGLIADFFQMPQLRHVLYACSILFPVAAVSAVSSKLLERSHAFYHLAKGEVAGFLVGHVIVGLSLAALGWGVWALVGANLVTGLISSVILIRARPHRLRLGIHLATYRDLMRHGAGYSLQRLSNIISLKGDYFVVGRALGPIALGQYERAYFLMNVSNRLIMNPLNKILFPAFSRISHDPERMRRAFLRCNALVATIFLPISVFAVILAPEIVAILLGGQWSETILPFQILAAGLFLRTGYRVAAIAMNSMAQVYRSTLSQGIYAVFVVGGALLFVKWGINGVAVSTLVAIGVVYALLTTTVTGSIGLKWSDLARAAAPAFVSAAVLGLIVSGTAYLMRHLQAGPFLTVAASAGISGACLLMLVSIWPALLGRYALEALAPATTRLCRMLAARNLPTRWLNRFLLKVDEQSAEDVSSHADH